MKRIIIALFLALMLTGCNKQMESLTEVEDCITNSCEDTEIEELLGAYVGEYIAAEFDTNPFINSEQRPNFYGQEQGSILGVGYVDETASYSDVISNLEALEMIYQAVSDVDVSISTVVNYSSTYSVREDNNSYTATFSFDPYEEYDTLTLTFHFTDEYNPETVLTVLSYVEDLEDYFTDYDEVYLWIYTTNEDVKITYTLQTQDLLIELENIHDTINPDTRLSELQTVVENHLEEDYQCTTHYNPE